jgi:hypothetical protein
MVIETPNISNASQWPERERANIIEFFREKERESCFGNLLKAKLPQLVRQEKNTIWRHPPSHTQTNWAVAMLVFIEHMQKLTNEQIKLRTEND